MIQLSSAVNYLCTPIWIPLSCSDNQFFSAT